MDLNFDEITTVTHSSIQCQNKSIRSSVSLHFQLPSEPNVLELMVRDSIKNKFANILLQLNHSEVRRNGMTSHFGIQFSQSVEFETWACRKTRSK